MPYKDISELPESVRNALPEEAQKLFLEVVNSALKQYDGDEAKAFATAWSAVKKQYSKQGDKWVRHAEAGAMFRELRFNFASGKFQELNGGLLLKDVKLLASGTWTDSNVGSPLYYPPEVLQRYYSNWLDSAVWSRHNGGTPRDITDKIGEVRNQRFESDAVMGDIFLHGKTSKSRDTIELIKAGMANFVSVEHGGKENWNVGMKRYEAQDLAFGGVAVVNKGACTVCTIQNESITGDVRQLADKYSKEDMAGMLDFMKANPGMMDKSMMDKMYATMDGANKKEMMKGVLKDLKDHPEMMDDEMKGMMKGMMGGKEMSSSLSAEAEMMELKQLEAKLTETERQLAESTKNVTALQGTVKELQEASVGKDAKIVEFERQLGEHKKQTEDTVRQLGEAVQRIETIEKTPAPQTVITGNGGFQLGSVPVYNPIQVKNGEITMEVF